MSYKIEWSDLEGSITSVTGIEAAASRCKQYIQRSHAHNTFKVIFEPDCHMLVFDGKLRSCKQLTAAEADRFTKAMFGH
ncbi:hypothetical protein KC902_01225 [Candidatus Kaiserbacteria bacterium]|nr:hypothetical protein [Candidatus Kaiserbacteria bacterium]USN88377.1 MAG: hypothetical protein H6780_02645 [Candidatus Nomurabacteria bacterium]